MIFNKNDYDSKQRFGIRKLSVGVCSVLLSTLFLTMNNNQTVHASTETESSESVEASASSGSNVEDQSASNSATTTVTSESTQTEASGTPSAQSESSKNGAAQLKTSGAETPKKPDSSTIQIKNETNSSTQTTPVENTTQKTTTFNVSNFFADEANVNVLQENKAVAATATTATTNREYDSATWGTLDTSKWTGQNTTFDGTNYYQLTGYTGDQTHIIVPNEADFAAANKSTDGLQVSISNDLIKSWQNAATIAFSKTDDKKIKLASNNLNGTFQNDTKLTNLDANSLDTSSVTSMQSTFEGTSNLSSLTGISDWDVSNVTNMYLLFQNATGLTSLTGLENWNTSKVTNLEAAFANEGSLVDASAIANWNTSNVTNMTNLFAGSSAQYVDFSNWNFSKVTSASNVINNTQSVIYLGPLLLIS